MASGMEMMLKSLLNSLNIDPKMITGVANAVQSAAKDLHEIKMNQKFLIQQNEEILIRLRHLTPDLIVQPIENETVPQLALVNNGR